VIESGMRRLIVVAFLFGACASTAQPRGTRETTPAVKEGVARLSDPLHECYEQHHKGGYVQAQMTIEKDGHVSAVTLDPPFAGTPAGECVKKVLLERGRFELDHGPIIIRYPLLLR